MKWLDSILQKVSFLTPGNIVERFEDEWGHIFVVDDDDFRLLKFDSIYEQSRMNRIYPNKPIHDYIRAMLLSLTLKPVNSALVLGLGGGSLLRALHEYDRKMSINVVELRRSVIDIAEKFFSLPASKNVNIICEDARNYMSILSDDRYDVIYSDLYWSLEMNPVQTEHQFLLNCYNKLNARGWLVINYYQIPNIDSPTFRSLRSIFKELLMCVTPSGNVIIFASPMAQREVFTHMHSNVNFVSEKLSAPLEKLSRKVVRVAAELS